MKIFCSYFLTISLSLFFCFSLSAQLEDNTDDKSNLSVKENDFMITGFTSIPNWGTYTAELALASSSSQGAFGIQDYNVRGISPSGIQIEYMLADIFGITVDGIYNSWNASWTSFDQNSELVESSAKAQRVRVLLGLNYHMDDLKNDKINIYGGFAVGYNNRTTEVKNNSGTVEQFWDSLIAFPMAGRVRAGLRYFLTEDIGLSAELGAGGPVLRFALTYKMSTTEN